jgi:hypothetical protein
MDREYYIHAIKSKKPHKLLCDSLFKDGCFFLVKDTVHVAVTIFQYGVVAPATKGYGGYSHGPLNFGHVEDRDGYATKVSIGHNFSSIRIVIGQIFI